MRKEFGQCKDCIFWRDTYSGVPQDAAYDHIEGRCTAGAPSLIQTAMIGHAATKWPVTKAREGCGDFQRRPDRSEYPDFTPRAQ